MLKRLLLTVVVLISSIMMYAQIKVAILPAADKTGEIKYGLKLLLTSSITSAISMTEGYEAYDRIDLSSVLDEQSFQRTGMVSDTEIHKIGEMTGASFVLITEAAYIDDSHVIATAKIVNVESAKIENSAVGMMDLGNSERLLNDCKVLTDKLLKGTSDTSENEDPNKKASTTDNQEKNPNTTTNSAQEVNTPINLILNVVGDNKNNEVATAPVSKPAIREVQPIYRRKGNLYLERTGSKLSSDACSYILGDDLYSQYKKAHSQYNLGKTFKIIGIVCVAAGVISIAAGGESHTYTEYDYRGNIVYQEGGDADYSQGYTYLALGAASFIPGIIIKKKAAKKIDGIVDKNNYGNYTSTKIDVSPSLMLTAQNDIGMGVLFSFSF